jgi:hypothetical protein
MEERARHRFQLVPGPDAWTLVIERRLRDAAELDYLASEDCMDHDQMEELRRAAATPPPCGDLTPPEPTQWLSAGQVSE